MASKTNRKSMRIVPPGRKKCVWMEAGVVSYKLCDNNYDCPTCAYDQGMQVKAARQKEAAATVPPMERKAEKFSETWVEKMMQLPASHRKCRYMLTGEVQRKICPNAYECGNCSFDQMMQARMETEPLPVHALKDVAGFKLAEEVYYHEGHTWAKPEYGGRVRVGLDDFAQKILGTLSKIETPHIGLEVQHGEVAFSVKRNGETAHVLSPLDGTVSHVNDKILGNPGLVNESPYEHGWLFVIEPTSLRKNLKSLYYGKEAQQFTTEEKEKLVSLANEDMQIAADGGVPVEDAFNELKGEDWTKLVKTFLKT